MKKIYLICSLFLFGCSNSEATDPLEDLTSSKWSNGDTPCDFQGGLYTEYGEEYPGGVSLTINGEKTNTEQKTWHEFIVNKDGSITFNSKTFADGNDFMTQFVDPETPVDISESKIKIEGDKLYKKGKIKTIDLNALLSEKKVVTYEEQNIDNISNRCDMPVEGHNDMLDEGSRKQTEMRIIPGEIYINDNGRACRKITQLVVKNGKNYSDENIMCKYGNNWKKEP